MTHERRLNRMERDSGAPWARAILMITLLSSSARAAGNITAVWANSGEDKITRDELRATTGSGKVTNALWNGQKISIAGACNEVVNFNLVLEAGKTSASGVSVSFNSLSNGTGGTIQSAPAALNGVFNWVGRPIELFFVRYLQIKGLSLLNYGYYDERHIPAKLRRPWSGNGAGTGNWVDRPNHDKFYPDIAVPLELVPTFSIAAGQNQSIWVDIYIPKNLSPGVYRGNVKVAEGGVQRAIVPVELTVFGFTLPDTPNGKTMLYYASSDAYRRFFGNVYVGSGDPNFQRAKTVTDRYFMLAQRHRVSLIGESGLDGDCRGADSPCDSTRGRLDGSFFSAANGYDGPGSQTSIGVYSICTYGGWAWDKTSEAAMWTHSDAWQTWFEKNAPAVEHFIYLVDESKNYAQTETWAKWIQENPGPGRRLPSMATEGFVPALTQTPSVNFPTQAAGPAITDATQSAADQLAQQAGKRLYSYNGDRPWSGSFAIEDEGVSLRELAWGQYKKKIARWFYWIANYYTDFQAGGGERSLFTNACTFGSGGTQDPVIGETGYLHSNGEGVLMYPGTDTLFPADSYNVDGPFASLRLKHWRRGIQDADYLALAAQADPAAVSALISKMVPKALWEVGVNDPADPSWVLADISWSTDPDVWEAARTKLATLIRKDVPVSISPVVPLAPRVYPNPWRTDKHAGKAITFDNLSSRSSVKIYTVSGRLAKDLGTVSASVTWDLTNASDEKVASGIYIYLIVDDQGNKVRGKVAVLR